MSSKKKSSSSEQKENSNDAPLSPYERILACRLNPPGPAEYYVKLREKSYQNSKWISVEDLQKNSQSAAMLTRFIKNQRDFPISPPYYDPQYDIIDRIICKKDRKYFVKWMGLGYEQATWEPEKTVSDEAREDFNLRQKQVHPLKSGDIDKQPSINIQPVDSYEFCGEALESYQVATMNLLLSNYSKMKNTDIIDRYNTQLITPCAAFFEKVLQLSLTKENNGTAPPTTRGRRSRSQKLEETESLDSENGGEFGPILIVAQLKPTVKWYNTFRSIKNATTLNYTGQKEGRQTAVETDFYQNGGEKLKFHVLITTPEILDHDMEILSSIKWRLAIFADTSVKKPQSKLVKVLQHFAIGCKITLMQSQPPNYSALKKLTDLLIDSCTNPYIDEETKKAAQTVRSQIQPKVLKKKGTSGYDEEKDSFKTYYIDCPLSDIQKKILKQIIRESARYVQKNNFIPICQRILRICQHPFLLYSQEYNLSGVDLISSSTKLSTLEKLMIQKVSQEPNKILIMSDFSLMLDMIEDIAKVHEIPIERILSQSKEVQNEEAIVYLYNPKYCSISSSLFKTMDTIIVYDGDGYELEKMLQINKPPNLHEIFKFHCRDCSEETLSRMCILNNINIDDIQPQKCESICKLAALAAYSDKKAPDAETIIKNPTIVINSFNPNEILEKEFDSCNFWDYLVDKEEMNKSQNESKEGVDLDYISNNEDSYEWTCRDRDQLLRGLCRFGFNRWKEMRIQTGLKQISMKNMVNASRALAREMIRILGSGSGHAVTRDFIKETSTKEEDEFNDKEFINSSCFSSSDFKMNLQNNVVPYLREIENIHFLGDSIKVKNDVDVYEISLPHPSGQLPKWWKDDYDRYLVYGTWKYGLGCYDQFIEDNDQEILKIFGPSDDQIDQKDLTDRALKLADTIKRKQSVGQRNEGSSDRNQSKKDNAAYQPTNSTQNYQSDSEFSSSSSTPVSNPISTRRKAESSGHSYDDNNYGSEQKMSKLTREYKSDIYQYLIRWGVPEDENGNPDYDTFAHGSGLDQYLSVDEVRDMVEEYLEKCQIPQEEGGNPPNTSNKINTRCNAMKQLREIIRKEDLAPQVFKQVQHWRYVPKEWTPVHEYKYFKEILNIGLVNEEYEKILQNGDFNDVFTVKPAPPFMFDVIKVMKRINMIYSTLVEIEKNGIKIDTKKSTSTSTSNAALTQSDKPKSKNQKSQSQSAASQPPNAVKKSKKKVPVPNGYTIQSNRSLFPADRAIFDGRVNFPLRIGDGKIILELGTVIPEREDFHTDRYIYPIGYKVSNRLPSATEAGKQTQWICKIGVENEEDQDKEAEPIQVPSNIASNDPTDSLDPTELQDPQYRLCFKSWMENNSVNKVYKGQTASAVWAEICNDIGKVNNGNKPTISGIDAFLLSNQAVIYLIQHMKGAKRCHQYKAKAVELPPMAQKMREWTQNQGVAFGQAALNEPTIETGNEKATQQQQQQQTSSSSSSSSSKKKKSSKKQLKDEDENDDFDEEATKDEDVDDDAEEEEEEEDFEEDEEDYEEEEEEKKETSRRKKKPTQQTVTAKKPPVTATSKITSPTQPLSPNLTVTPQAPNTQPAPTAQPPSKPPPNKKSSSKKSAKNQAINQPPAMPISGPPVIQMPQTFQMPQQGQIMQTPFMQYNKPPMMPAAPLMNAGMIKPPPAIPPNFFMQNNVQKAQAPFMQPGFMKPPQMQPQFMQQPAVMQQAGMMMNQQNNNNNNGQVQQQPEQNSHLAKQPESNFNDSNPVNNQ